LLGSHELEWTRRRSEAADPARRFRPSTAPLYLPADETMVGWEFETGGYPPGYYAAFVLDPEGNNIEAVFMVG